LYTHDTDADQWRGAGDESIDASMTSINTSMVAAGFSNLEHGLEHGLPYGVQEGASPSVESPALSLPHLMRPSADIERDVIAAVAKVPQIVSVSHMVVHWLPERAGSAVEVEVTMDAGLLVRDAHALARQARVAIEQIDDVIEADLHLELDDGPDGIWTSISGTAPQSRSE
jgi:hypothetical protein